MIHTVFQLLEIRRAPIIQRHGHKIIARLQVHGIQAMPSNTVLVSAAAVEIQIEQMTSPTRFIKVDTIFRIQEAVVLKGCMDITGAPLSIGVYIQTVGGRADAIARVTAKLVQLAADSIQRKASATVTHGRVIEKINRRIVANQLKSLTTCRGTIVLQQRVSSGAI